MVSFRLRRNQSLIPVGPVVAAVLMTIVTQGSVAVAEEPAPTTIEVVRLPPPVETNRPSSRRVSFPAPQANVDVVDRLQDLEQIVKQQQMNINALQDRLRLANMPPTGNPSGLGQQTNTAATSANADAAKESVVGSDLSMTGKWTPNGGELQTQNGDFKVKLAGRVQADAAFIQEPDPARITSVPGGAGTKDSFYFRRLRLGAYGTMWEQIDWATEFDIANTEFNIDPVAGGNNPATGLRSSAAFPAGGNVMSVVAPTDVWMTFRELPVVGNVRVGNQKEMIGLEHMTSSRFLDFMERSPLQDAFNGPNNNGYTPGVSAYDTLAEQRATWALGIFKNNDYENGFTYDVGNNNYSFNSRFTWTPYYDEPTEGRYMVHVGVGSAYRTFDTEPAGYTGGTNVRIRARGDIRNIPSTLPPNYADTGNFYATSQGLVNPEIALVWGPWLVQAEYEYCHMGQASPIQGGASLGEVHFQGGYVEVMCFLTGEHRAYNRLTANFGRVVPFNNAYWTRGVGFCGAGAWQVGLRFDWLDLNSGLVNGGNMQDITLGLNWFLNPNTKLQFNYVAAWVNNTTPVAGANNSLNGARFVGDGVINSVGTRLAWDF
jgi:phosphate-selective porin OprO/OprP